MYCSHFRFDIPTVEWLYRYQSSIKKPAHCSETLSNNTMEPTYIINMDDNDKEEDEIVDEN
jgi:hypothetical protein